MTKPRNPHPEAFVLSSVFACPASNALYTPNPEGYDRWQGVTVIQLLRNVDCRQIRAAATVGSRGGREDRPDLTCDSLRERWRKGAGLLGLARGDQALMPVIRSSGEARWSLVEGLGEGKNSQVFTAANAVHPLGEYGERVAAVGQEAVGDDPIAGRRIQGGAVQLDAGRADPVAYGPSG